MRFEPKTPEDPARVVVRQHLERAGATLMALPGGTGVGRLGSGMPEVVREFFEGYNREPARMRVPRPTGEQIDHMDAVLKWVCLIPPDPPPAGAGLLHALGGGVLQRRLVSARMLVFPSGHPRAGAYLYSWAKLADFAGCDRRTLPAWHGVALDKIIAGLRANPAFAAKAQFG